jgi:glycosyltransferase involved in cell wall biosynthesis
MSGSVNLTILHPADPAGPKIGGAETFLWEFLRFAPDDLEITLVGVSCDEQKRPANRLIEMDMAGRPFSFLPVLIEGADVVLHNRIESLASVGMSSSGNIVIIHNDIPQQISGNNSEVLWSRMPSAYYWFERRVLDRCDRIFTVSNSTMRDYQKRYPQLKDRLEFVPTCVDGDFFCPDRTSEGVQRLLTRYIPVAKADSPLILFVGRLQKQKAPDRLIKTMARLVCQMNEPTLLVAGDGNLMPECAELVARYGLEERVHFLGAKTKLELADLYRVADVLLLSSNYEGMPLCVLESLASGTPVVSTPVGELSRVVVNGINGEVVKSFSESDLADAVVQVTGNADRYSSENCRKSIAAYSPLVVMEPIYDCLKAVARDRMNGRNANCSASLPDNPA